MKKLRILAFLLVCAMALPLFSCTGGNDTPDETDESTAEDTTAEETTAEETTAEEETTAPEIKNYDEVRTFKITEKLDKIKTFGRTSVTAQGLACDHTATGIEFNAAVKGKITLSVVLKSNNASVKDCYFTLWVDGVRQETRFKAVDGQTTTFELGNFETEGVHNFRFVRQNEAHWANVDMTTLSFAGWFEERPADADLYIEFIGASMFGGYGNLGTTSTKNPSYPLNSDGTQAYPYLTAQALGADHSIVSRSGIGVLKGSSLPGYKTIYMANSYFRSETVAYKPTRVPDVIVSGIGHNDINNMKGSGTTLPEAALANYKKEIKDLVTSIWMLYGKTVPIVWTHNMMGTSSENFVIYANTVEEAFKELGGENSNLYVLKLTSNRSGGGSHPTIKGHQTQSSELVAFLKAKGLAK